MSWGYFPAKMKKIFMHINIQKVTRSKTLHIRNYDPSNDYNNFMKHLFTFGNTFFFSMWLVAGFEHKFMDNGATALSVFGFAVHGF
jgi:hypothetical protein